MKKSLSLKLFATIVLSFFIMIIGIIFTLDIYFNHFYENKKIENIVSNINDFADSYSQNNWNKEEIFRQTGIFSSANNASLIISQEESEHAGKHMESESNVVLITVVDENDNFFDFFISSERYERFNLKIGSTIDLIGYLNKDSVIVPMYINNIKLESAEENKDEYKNFESTVKIANIKMNLTLPSIKEERIIYKNLYSSNISDVEYTVTEIPHTDVRQVDFIKEVASKNGLKAKIFVNVSLQSVGETLNVVKSFYPYFLVFSLLLALAISFVYSKTVTKPILNITNIADNMANMNFSKKLDISRKDELGKLSNSLNTLSFNLENALDKLTVANEELKEDYKRKVKQEQIRKEFIANVSHELKTPLSIIKGYAEGIKDGVNEGERDEYINIISDEIRRMDKLILEMLWISKYDSMDIKVKKQNVDILILINDRVQTFENSLSKKELLVDIIGEFGICNIDKEKITMAFSNLFNNAVKYADKNSKIIIKGIMNKAKNKIELHNNCKPFTDEQLEKVWERFYRVDTSHNTEIEGTGLGLSIVKSIFDAHEINYGAYNAENGVVFWFEV